MKVLANTAAGYKVECGCGTQFQVLTVRMTFECPRCGTIAPAADTISEFMLSGMGVQDAIS